MNEEQRHRAEWEADGYRAIGRWWVQFSRLIGAMRTYMEYRLLKPGDEAALVALPFSGASAGQIADAFFGMCRLVGSLDPTENNIANQLQKEVSQAIVLRNKLGHGDWLIGQGTEEADDPTIRTYVIRFYTTAPHRRVETLTARDLDQKSDRLQVLIRMIYPFGCIALDIPVLTANGLVAGGTYRVSDVLIAEDVPKKSGKGGRVMRSGRKASEIL